MSQARPATAPLPATRLSVAEVPAAVRPVVSAIDAGRDLRESIGTAVRTLGYDGFVFDRACRDRDHASVDVATWGDVPEAWAEVYRQRNYAAIDPRYAAAARTAIPEVWERDRYPDTPVLREFFDAAAAHGLRSGIVFVVNQPNSAHLDFFAVHSSQREAEGGRRRAIARAIGDLWAIGAYGYRMLPPQALASPEPRGDLRRLSRRELECLSLVASGATSRDIAGQLAISERTANAHIERAIRKLGAKNRQEAVARAISRGAIRL